MRRSSGLNLSNLSPRQLNGILAALIVMICGALANALYANWQSDQQRASIEVENVSSGLSQNILRTIELADLAIQGVIDGIGNPAVRSAPKELRQLMLFQRAATVPFLGQLLLIGPTGELLANSLTVDPAPRSYSDRDYFRIQQQRPEFGLFVSRPLTSRTDGARMIAISRRITNPDGSFGGVVTATLLIDFLHQQFTRMHLGEHGSITLFRTDGTMIMREPYDPSVIGLRRPPALLFDLASRSDVGEYEAHSVVDDIVRLYHFNRIGKLPLVVCVGLAVADVHREWWHRTLLTCSVVAAASLIILLLNIRLGRELRGRKEAEAALMTLVDKDGLTGLGNRRCFDRVLHAGWARAARLGQPLALLMIDADHFKAYNDRFGHAAGDEVLRQIAQTLDKHARRADDLAARYGGEEFAMVLPGLNLQEACRLADSIRVAILALALPHPASPADHLTVSIGCVSRTPTPGQSVDDLVRAADQALYRSKRDGRNRVSFDEPTERASLRLAS